jgi:glycosyltransferase involved in cell wall biosynthesis
MSEGSSAELTEVAYVTARFPPMMSSGTFRAEAVRRFLPDHGFHVTVVTLPMAWVAQQAGGALDSPTPEESVIRPTTATDRLIRWMATTRGIRWLLRAILLPDILAPWARQVGRRVRLGTPGVLYATGPPFSALVAGKYLAKRHKVPYVLEIRDPPSFNRRLRGRSNLIRMRMLWFERRLLTQADAVIVVTPGVKHRLLSLHPALDPDRVTVVTNGYPELTIDPALSDRDHTRFTVAYVGSFQGGGSTGSRFTPEVLLPALQTLPPDTVRLRMVGPLTSAQADRLGVSYPGLVQPVGVVPRSQALAEVATADVVLIVAEDDPWWIGRKVFEAMAYARRILAVVPPGDTAELLKTSPKAEVVNLDDGTALVERVQQLYREWLAGSVLPVNAAHGQTDRTCVAEIASVLRRVLRGEEVDQDSIESS